MHTGKRPGVPEVNVWGISDKDLFLEANELFREKDKPFFAYIQTSGNHRPYNKTIPMADSDFVKIAVPEAELKRYGFESIDELNCFWYPVYFIQKFMEAATQEKNFHNQVFFSQKMRQDEAEKEKKDPPDRQPG